MDYGRVVPRLELSEAGRFFVQSEELHKRRINRIMKQSGVTEHPKLRIGQWVGEV
jgi:hypothetical protein